MKDKDYSEINLMPDSKVTPLGNCRFDIDGHEIEFRIRKLTPRECLRLMDVSEPNINKMMGADIDGKQIISNSQLYKLAGNSIVVSCMTHIFERIFFPKNAAPITQPRRLTIFDQLL